MKRQYFVSLGYCMQKYAFEYIKGIELVRPQENCSWLRTQYIYIRTVRFQLFLCSNTLFFFLAGLGQKSSVLCIVLFPMTRKPGQQSRQQAYCPNYILWLRRKDIQTKGRHSKLFKLSDLQTVFFHGYIFLGYTCANLAPSK